MFLGRHLSLRYKARQFLAIRTDPGDAFTLVKPFAREYLRLAVVDRGQRVAILGNSTRHPEVNCRRVAAKSTMYGLQGVVGYAFE